MKRALVAAFAVCAAARPVVPRRRHRASSAVDTSSFPELRVTVVAPLGAKAPTPA